MRPLRYYIHYTIGNWFPVVLAPLQRYLRSATALATIDGIKIVDSGRKKDPRFYSDTVTALELIKSADPRRYRRLQREVRFITNMEKIEQLGWASYNRSWRSCEVDYRRMNTDRESRDWSLRAYAATLVHEATHGAIYSRYIAYVPRLRARIEKLCVTEANRFVKRLDTPEVCWSESLACPFDEKDWHSSWYIPYPQRVKMAWQVLREAFRRNHEE